MDHPGPPRFAAVGDEIELAPRDPDPTATYEWRLGAAPPGSTATLGDDPVERLRPDVPGTYAVELATPETVHELTVRAFAERRRPGPGAPGAGYSGRAATERADDDAVQGEGASGPATDAGSGIHRLRPADDEPVRPRIHLRPTVTDEDVRIESDVHPTPGPGESGPRVEFVVDDRDDLARAAVTVESGTLRVPRERLPDRARIHAVAVEEGAYSVADAVDLRRTGGGIEAIRPYDPPEWATDATIYEVYVRAFPGQEDDRAPFEAIHDRLGYLADLGVDALWLTPVLQNDHAPHGYNITDFFSIAADLGTRADFERLVAAAHDHGMRVLFDLVFNHSAREHPYFRDAYRNPDSPYRAWYEWQDSGEPGTYFDWEYIANFDFDCLAVRRHLLDVVDAWAPLVDGFRCDMAWAVPNPFWTEIHDRVKRRDADFFLLDETIPYIPEFAAGLFDVHFDSTTAFTLREIGAGNAPADAVLDAVAERRRIGFPDHAGFMLYVENHDETRYLRKCGKPAAMAAAGAIATLPGAPMVYAGQEFGQLGKRDDLDWTNAHDDLRAHYRRLLALRDAHPALASDAALDPVEYEVRAGDPDAVTAYLRAAPNAPADAPGERAVVAVLNFADAPAEVDLAPAVGGTDLVRETPVGTDPVTVEDVTVLPADVRVVGGVSGEEE